MSSTDYYQHDGYYYPTSSQPIAVPSKETAPMYTFDYDYSRVSSSPPDATDVSSMGGPSYDVSAASYAASTSDVGEPNQGVSSVDLLEFMNERLQNSYNPIAMDKSLLQQVQTSGELNAKQRQLMELQAIAAQKMAELQASMASNIGNARSIQKDLESTQKKVKSLNKKAAKKYAEEYARAQERYPSSHY